MSVHVIALTSPSKRGQCVMGPIFRLFSEQRNLICFSSSVGLERYRMVYWPASQFSSVLRSVVNQLPILLKCLAKPMLPCMKVHHEGCFSLVCICLYTISHIVCFCLILTTRADLLELVFTRKWLTHRKAICSTIETPLRQRSIKIWRNCTPHQHHKALRK